MLVWTVFSQICLPIFVLIGCGFVLDRKFRFSLETMVRLNLYFLIPVFIFRSLVNATLSGELALRVILFTLTIIASMFALAEIAGRLNGYPAAQRRTLQLATMFYNSGNYGIPLMTLAYPTLGPVLQVFTVVTQNVCQFTVGVLLLSGDRRKGWRNALPLLRQGTVWALSAVLLVQWLKIPVKHWPWLWVPVEYVASGFIPVALVTLGIQLSQTSHRQEWSRLTWALGLRLLGGPALAVLLVPLFGFRGDAASIMILSTAVPTAVNTALLAHEFKADTQFAAAAVFYSTLASMVTVTVVVTLLRLSQRL